MHSIPFSSVPHLTISVIVSVLCACASASFDTRMQAQQASCLGMAQQQTAVKS